MKSLTGSAKVSIASAVLVFSLCACDSDRSSPDLMADSGIDDEPLPQCDATEFDHAELLYTEIDRQWVCSVDTAQSTFTEEMYFQRAGTAVFGRLGPVYWNRTKSTAEDADEITVASPSIETHVMSEIQSANTTLSFVMRGGASEERYDCVLAGRDVIGPL